MKKIADIITELSLDNTLTEWSITISSLTPKQEHVYVNGISTVGVFGYVAGFGFGSLPILAKCEIDKINYKNLSNI